MTARDLCLRFVDAALAADATHETIIDAGLGLAFSSFSDEATDDEVRAFIERHIIARRGRIEGKS